SPLVSTNATVVVACKPVQTTLTAIPAVALGTTFGLPAYVQLDVDGGIGVAAAGAAVSAAGTARSRAGAAVTATSNAPRSPATPSTAVTRRRPLLLYMASSSWVARTRLRSTGVSGTCQRERTAQELPDAAATQEATSPWSLGGRGAGGP